MKNKKIKVVIDLIKKRIKKKVATSEFYKTEMPEHFDTFINSAKITTALSFILVIIFHSLNFTPLKIISILSVFLFGFMFFQICNVTFKGWARLNKLHKIIEEEKFEIEHHRPKERKELEVLYKAKGFSGKLLEDVIDVLMADDNRLLQVMMEEEMGLTLERYEHPLKQGIFSAISVAFSSLLLLLGLYGSLYEFFIIGSFINILSSMFSFKKEKTNLSFIIIWNLAILAFISFITFFASKFLP